MGIDDADLQSLNPCVPGEFTSPDAYYVNTATPKAVYLGSEEGTLPLIAGRWYLVSGDTVRRNPALMRDAAPVSRAVRLAR